MDDTYDYTHLICPHCGYAHDDMFESGLEDGVEADYECDGCGKTFIALFEISHSYTGKIKESLDANRLPITCNRKDE